MKKTFLLLLLGVSLFACRRTTVDKPEAITTIVPIVEVSDTVLLTNQVYSALAGGLSMRARPNADAPVIGKIEYGEVVTLPPPYTPENDSLLLKADTPVRLHIGGMSTYWVPVMLAGDTGYVAEAYLSNYPPPPAGTPHLKAWADAMGKPWGKKFVSQPKVQTLYENNIGVYRQLYNNGTVYSEATGYEYFRASLQLPNTTVLKVLNSLRNLKEFEAVLNPKFPLKKGSYTVTDSTVTYGYQWLTTYDPQGLFLESVTISWSEGSYNTLTIRQLETEVLVSFSSGL